MITIYLERMGADFYTDKDKRASDMGNFRLRPAYGGLPSIMNYYLKDRDGHYISGDFRFFRPSKGQEGYPEPRLVIDFTDYGTDMRDSRVYDRAKAYSGTVSPTLSNIKGWLEIALGEEVRVILEEYINYD